jgi:hypothetical protein
MPEPVRDQPDGNAEWQGTIQKPHAVARGARRRRELRGIVVKVSIAYRSLKLERILSANL